MWNLNVAARLAWGISDRYKALAWEIAGDRSGIGAFQEAALARRGLIDPKKKRDDKSLMFLLLAMQGAVAGAADPDEKKRQMSWTEDEWRSAAEAVPVSSAYAVVAEDGAERLAARTRAFADQAAREILESTSSRMRLWQSQLGLSVIFGATLRRLSMAATEEELALLIDRLGANLETKWMMIADEEAQTVYNEGQLVAIADKSVDGDKVARVPEHDACSKCLTLFVDGDRLRLFSASDLLRAPGGVASVAPVHPHCRCWLLHVPAGHYATRDGALFPVDEAQHGSDL